MSTSQLSREDDNSEASNYICGICVNNIEYQAQEFRTRCNHSFHLVCFNTRLGAKTVCPVCSAYLQSPTPSLAEELTASQEEALDMPRLRSQGIDEAAQAEEPRLNRSSEQEHTAPSADTSISNRDTEAVVRMQDGIAQLNISITQTMAQISQMAQAMSQLPSAIEGGFCRLSTLNGPPPQTATARERFIQSLGANTVRHTNRQGNRPQVRELTIPPTPIEEELGQDISAVTLELV